MQLLNIGYGNLIFSDRIIGIVNPASAPIKRLIKETEQNKIIDATCGRKKRAVIITDSGHLILSALQPDTIAGRIVKVDEDKNFNLNKEEDLK